MAMFYIGEKHLNSLVNDEAYKVKKMYFANIANNK